MTDAICQARDKSPVATILPAIIDAPALDKPANALRRRVKLATWSAGGAWLVKTCMVSTWAVPKREAKKIKVIAV